MCSYAVEVVGNLVVGVVVEGQKLTADTVVLANGYGARALALTVGVDLPIQQSPAVLLRFGSEAYGLRHLICAQEMELRPSVGAGLFLRPTIQKTVKTASPLLQRSLATQLLN